MILSFCLDRYNDIKLEDHELIQVQARILAMNGYRIYYCRYRDGDMYCRFAKSEPRASDTPGYQGVRVLEGKAWNNQPYARVYFYRNDPKTCGHRLAADVVARRDDHVDIWDLPYIDDAEMMDPLEREDDDY